MTVIGMGGHSKPDSESTFGNVRPRVGTQRDPDRETLGYLATELADVIGFPLLEWQQYALDVGMETVDDMVDRWAYSDVAIAVSRQNGKTGGVLQPRILVGLLQLGEKILHSAQNRDLPQRVVSGNR